MSPKTREDFRERAANCERMAAKTKDPQVRQTFQYIASKWRAFAADDGRERSRRSTDGKSLSVE
jgi:hypothetical protein